MVSIWLSYCLSNGVDSLREMGRLEWLVYIFDILHLGLPISYVINSI